MSNESNVFEGEELEKWLRTGWIYGAAAERLTGRLQFFTGKFSLVPRPPRWKYIGEHSGKLQSQEIRDVAALLTCTKQSRGLFFSSKRRSSLVFREASIFQRTEIRLVDFNLLTTNRSSAGRPTTEFLGKAALLSIVKLPECQVRRNELSHAWLIDEWERRAYEREKEKHGEKKRVAYHGVVG